MEIVNKKIDELKPYANNPRFNEDAVEYVANSIKEFGFKVPMVIDKNNEIVAGHTRFKAALELGLEEVPCIVADDLTEEQIKAFRLADNKVSEKSQWNLELLDEELSSILDIDMSNFDFLDIEKSLEEMDEENELENIQPEIEFTEYLGEETNYVVLKFDNSTDWLNALSVLQLKNVKDLPNRIDGTVNENASHIGIGRVVDGVEAMEMIRGSVK